MRLFVYTVVGTVFLVLAQMYTTAFFQQEDAAAVRRPKPWTFQFRSGWNAACVEAMMPMMAQLPPEEQKDAIWFANFCDCSSDGLQWYYSEQEILEMGKSSQLPQHFKDRSKQVSADCLNGPI